jgi:hypothetical protein
MRTKLVTKRPRLRLGDTGCKVFEVTIEVSDKDFDHDKFLRSIPVNERFKQYAAICNRKTKQVDYQAEIYIHRLVKQPKDLAIHITLHPTKKGPIKVEAPPFAEDVFQWVHQFISKNASVDLVERCDFVFGPAYRSVFALPMIIGGPLNQTGNPVFEGSIMVGVRITVPPNTVGIFSATIEFVPKIGINMSLRRRTVADSAKLLTIESDVSVIHNVAASMVRKRGKQDDPRKK